MQTITGRNLDYSTALAIVQNENYLSAADLSVLRKKRDLVTMLYSFFFTNDKRQNKGLDTQHKDKQYNGTQHNDTRHKALIYDTLHTGHST